MGELERPYQSRYRIGVILFLLIGATTGIGAGLFSTVREVLLGVAGASSVGAVLLFTVISGRYISADVGASIVGTANENMQQLATELGFTGQHWYVQAEEEDNVRVVLPQKGQAGLPPISAHESIIESGDKHALAFHPSGCDMLQELVRSSGELSNEPDQAIKTLCRGASEMFELADTVRVVEVGEDFLKVRVINGALGNGQALDDPIQSLLGVGLVQVTEVPVEVSETTLNGPDDVILTYVW